MERLITFFAFILLITQVQAQSIEGSLLGKWKIKKFGISAGEDKDMLKGLSHSYLLSTIKGSTEINYDELQFPEQDLTSMVCENPHIRATVTLLPPGMKNTELDLSLVGIFNRIDMVTYGTQGTDWGDPAHRSLDFSSYTNEIDLEGTLLKTLPVTRNFKLYGGVGTNMGYSFAGNVYVHGRNLLLKNDNTILYGPGEEDYENGTVQEYFNKEYQMKNGFHHRLFAQAGFGVTVFKRMELGMNYRYGVGYRVHGGAPVKGTILNSFGLSAKWVLK